jgi:hypothetical protein
MRIRSYPGSERVETPGSISRSSGKNHQGNTMLRYWESGDSMIQLEDRI